MREELRRRFFVDVTDADFFALTVDDDDVTVLPVRPRRVTLVSDDDDVSET